MQLCSRRTLIRIWQSDEILKFWPGSECKHIWFTPALIIGLDPQNVQLRGDTCTHIAVMQHLCVFANSVWDMWITNHARQSEAFLLLYAANYIISGMAYFAKDLHASHKTHPNQRFRQGIMLQDYLQIWRSCKRSWTSDGYQGRYVNYGHDARSWQLLILSYSILWCCLQLSVRLLGLNNTLYQWHFPKDTVHGSIYTEEVSGWKWMSCRLVGSSSNVWEFAMHLLLHPLCRSIQHHQFCWGTHACLLFSLFTVCSGDVSIVTSWDGQHFRLMLRQQIGQCCKLPDPDVDLFGRATHEERESSYSHKHTNLDHTAENCWSSARNSCFFSF